MNRVLTCCFAMVVWALLGSACATLSPPLETPSVKVLGVRPIAGSELTPRFEIDLLVVNPNDSALALRGASYQLFLNDLEVVEGVANDLPKVAAYGEADFTLPATLSLIAGTRFLASLLRGDETDVRWRLVARLDVSALLPAIRVVEEGTLALGASPP